MKNKPYFRTLASVGKEKDKMAFNILKDNVVYFSIFPSYSALIDYVG